jgi:hypothetical protein
VLHRKDLLGLWDLVSHEKQLANSKFVDFGTSATGSLVYLENSFFSVSINWGAGSPKDFLFYSGEFEFLPSEQIVIHRARNSSEPWRIGEPLERKVFSLSGGDELLLEGEAKEGLVRVKWRRKTDI